MKLLSITILALLLSACSGGGGRFSNKSRSSGPTEGTTGGASTDSDGDGISDALEIANGLNPNDPNDAGLDKDGDGLTNLQETQLGMDISDPTDGFGDTDGDGVLDAHEINNGLDPNDPSDNADTDGDGMPDFYEDLFGLDKNNPADGGATDTDGDGISNVIEIQNAMDPTVNDTAGDLDGDGISNADEITHGLNPLDPTDGATADTDGDGLSNLDEINNAMDPTNAADGNADTDGDGMSDGWEIRYGLNPAVDDSAADLDADGITNLDEYLWGLDPTSNLDGAAADTDGDGIDNITEIGNGTNPLVANILSGLVLSEVYAGNSDLLQYVKNDDGGLPWEQSNDACDGSELGTLASACVHAGIIREVIVTGVNTCSGLSAQDNGDVFIWTCDDSSGTAKFYSHGFKPGKGIRDLIGAGPAFVTKSVTISNGTNESVATTATTWWSNTLVDLNSGPYTNTGGADSRIELTASGSIYVATASKTTRGYFINGTTNIGVVTLDGVRLTVAGSDTDTLCSSGTNFCIFESNSNSSFAWFEVDIKGNSNDTNYGTNAAEPIGIYLKNTRLTQINNSTISNFHYGILGHAARSSVVTDTTTAFNFTGVYVKNATSDDFVLSRIKTYGNQGNGILLINGSDGSISFVNSIANDEAGIHASNNAESTKLLTSTGISNSTHGTMYTYLDTISSNSLANINNTWNGFFIGGSDGTNTNIAGLNNSSSGIEISASEVNDKWFGSLIIGSNSLACDVPVTSQSDLVDSTCLGGTIENANLTGTAANSYVGYLSSDDSAHPSDASGVINYANSAVNLTDFENPYRVFTKDDANAFPHPNHKGACKIGSNCRIFDARLLASDTVLRNTSGNGYTPNPLFRNGDNCPALLHGNKAITNQEAAPQTYLKLAIEITGDNIGDDDGLCESNEHCIYTPNFGAYQGEGDYYTKECVFDDDSDTTAIVNARIFAYPINGAGADIDSDGDGISDADEATLGFDPNDPDDGFADADGDGISNADEHNNGLNIYNSNDGASADSDSDGITNGDEINGFLDPNNAADGAGVDSDGDGVTNAQEVALGMNPLNPNDINHDIDDDGLTYTQEIALGFDPADASDGNADTDGDGLTNAQEYNNGLNMNSSSDGASIDTDGDGLTNLQEINLGMDPTNAADGNADTDGDGIKDSDEIIHGLDLNVDDASDDEDSDGMTNKEEIDNGLDPNVSNANDDPDGDGVDNISEIGNGSNPLVANILPGTLTVNTVYTGNSNWMDYIKNDDGGMPWEQSNDLCDGTETGTLASVCVHAGAVREVVVTGVSSCTGLIAQDSEDVFIWTCDSSSGTATFYSHGLKPHKGLKNLISYSGSASWKNISVTVSKGTDESVTSAATAWWSNTLIDLPANAGVSNMPLQLVPASGTIYVANTNMSTRGYYIDNIEKVGIVTLGSNLLSLNGDLDDLVCDSYKGVPDGTINAGNNDGYCFLSYANTSHFGWAEVNLQGLHTNTETEPSNGIVASETRFLRINNSKISNFDTGIYSAGTFQIGLFVSSTHLTFNKMYLVTSDHDTDYITLSRVNTSGSKESWIHSIDNAVFNFVHGVSGSSILETKNNNTDFYFTGVSSLNANNHYVDYNAEYFTLHNFLSFNNYYFMTVDTTNLTMSNFALLLSPNSPQTAIQIQNLTSSLKFKGNLMLDVPGGLCQINASATTNMDNTTCASSDIDNLNTSTDFSNAFVGKLSTDDSTNSSDTNGLHAFAAIFNTTDFDNFYRGYAKDDAQAFPHGNYRGTCDIGDNCVIFDARLLASDKTIRNTTGNAITQNPIFKNGDNCPALLHGNQTISNQQITPINYLKNAIEIVGDYIGNENGLCESNEHCIYTPNFGAYQGEGDYYTKECVFDDDSDTTTIVNARIFAYPINGAGADIDSDGDGISDTDEATLGFDPNDPDDGFADADGDGISNAQEHNNGLNIYSSADGATADTDGDGINNLDEINGFLDPNNAADGAGVDSDGDGIDNEVETANGMNPLNPNDINW